MKSAKPRIIVTRMLPEPIEQRMRELFGAELRHDDTPLSKEALCGKVAEADILVPTVTDEIDASVLSHARSLKLIANFGNGVDNIDVATALKRGITVTNTPGVLTDDTADITMALIMAVPRRIAEGIELVMSREWKGWGPMHMLGRRVTGKRLGIIGLGRIGQAVAKRAKAFGMQINYHNRRRVAPSIEQSLEATYWESLDQMLAHMDVISVHCPHTPATFHLLSARRLKLLRPEAYVVNTARGEIIDEGALARMIKRGELAGAGLDVFEYEPAINEDLLQTKNVVILPHMGSATMEGRIEMGERVLINIRIFLEGHRAPDRILPSML